MRGSRAYNYSYCFFLQTFTSLGTSQVQRSTEVPIEKYSWTDEGWMGSGAAYHEVI